MGYALRTWVGLAVVFAALAPANARIWKDATGHYTIDADLVGFDDDRVVLQRKNKELGSCPIDKLCKEDREYLKSKEALEIHTRNLDQTQTWAMSNGLKVVGKIANYERDEVVIQQRDGKVFINDKPFDDLPVIYQDILLRVIETVESIPMPNKQALENWVSTSATFKGGKSENYNLEGVVLELQDGARYAVPFYLFAEKEQKLLRSGWNAWLESHKAVPVPPEAATPTKSGNTLVPAPAKGLTPQGGTAGSELPPPVKGLTPDSANGEGAFSGLPKPASGITADLGNEVKTNPLGAGGANSARKPTGDNYKQEDQAFHLQSLASAYQRDQKVNRQIALMNLNLQAVQAGVTSAWEITLYPNSGNPYPPKWVVKYGRNSQIATQEALRGNPGYHSGPVRKVSR